MPCRIHGGSKCCPFSCSAGEEPVLEKATRKFKATTNSNLALPVASLIYWSELGSIGAGLDHRHHCHAKSK